MTSAGVHGSMRLVFAGGGTGGHLYPAIAIAEEIRRRQPGAEITFIGTEGGLESRVVPSRGYRFVTVAVSGFRRSISPSNVLVAGKMILALLQSFRLLRHVRPNVVIGTGGYVCGPPLYAASLMGIPTLIQEQNSTPGITTRLLAGRVREVHVTFGQTKRLLGNAENIFVTGNPTRAAIGNAGREASARVMGLDPSRVTVLVFGGSQGAASINRAIQGVLPDLLVLGAQIVWLTGVREYERVLAGLSSRSIEGGERIKLFPYYDQMEHAYGCADIAVCRAGATTIAELTRAGLASVLIPYPHAAADHQTSNARALADGGAAVLVGDSEAGERLPGVLRELVLDPSRRRAMGERARALGAPNAAEILADAVFRLAKT